MKVILQKNVETLGKAGDIVKVSEGYARNYLMPKGLASEADESSVKKLEEQRRSLNAKLAKEQKDAQDLAKKLSAHSCTISKKVGENDKIFGSVTSTDIETALVKDGFKVSKKDIVLNDPIKALGVYTVPVRICQGVEANVKVWVVQG